MLPMNWLDFLATMSFTFFASTIVPPHKHCRICQEPIPVKADPRVCKKQECIEKNEKDEKNQKTVRIMMFIFFGIFAVPYLLVLVTGLF